MATWIIGDVHGCDATLQRLLDRLDLDLEHDHLWFTGDLINRGPHSREVLHRARELERRIGERLVVVLGNHDVHLMSVRAGLRETKTRDTFDSLLEAPDCDELIDWLAHRPLVHRQGDLMLVHAGLPSSWTFADAEKQARKIEAELRDPCRRQRLLAPIGQGDGLDETRTSLADLTLLRTCTADGRHCSHKGPPEEAPPGCLPWFDIPGRRTVGKVLVFGHWAAMGLRLAPNLIALDSGCVWGRCLTAIRLEDRKIVQQPTLEYLAVLPAVRGSRKDRST